MKSLAGWGEGYPNDIIDEPDHPLRLEKKRLVRRGATLRAVLAVGIPLGIVALVVLSFSC